MGSGYPVFPLDVCMGGAAGDGEFMMWNFHCNGETLMQQTFVNTSSCSGTPSVSEEVTDFDAVCSGIPCEYITIDGGLNLLTGDCTDEDQEADWFFEFNFSVITECVAFNSTHSFDVECDDSAVNVVLYEGATCSGAAVNVDDAPETASELEHDYALPNDQVVTIGTESEPELEEDSNGRCFVCSASAASGLLSVQGLLAVVASVMSVMIV